MLSYAQRPQEKMMQRLLDGYAKFKTKVFPENKKLFAKLAHGQKPQALFITCSDSRVVPEMIMQCEPGDLFPCRNAGNMVPPHTETGDGVSATIEYAVRVLKVPSVVICGHSDCGAMKGLMDVDHLDELPLVKSWLENAGASSRWVRGFLKVSDGWSAEKKLQMLTEINVINQVQSLCLHPAVTEALAAGTVEVHGWIYDIGTGDIRRFDEKLGTFTDLIPAEPAAAVHDELLHQLKIA